MNKVILMGRLTADPKYTMGNSPEQERCNFSIAVDRKVKREGGTNADFFNCVAFRGTAAFIEKYFSKGNKILVTGHIQNDNYTNQHGEKVYSVGVVVEEVEFCESKGTNTEPSDGFMNIPEGVEEELPFN